MHKGGQINQQVVDAYDSMMAIPRERLHLKTVPTMVRPVVGDLPALNIKDVTALLNWIHIIIVTLDAALGVTQTAEEDMLRRLGETVRDGVYMDPATGLNAINHTTGRREARAAIGPFTLPRNEKMREGRIRGILQRTFLPEPLSLDGTVHLMKSNGLIHF